jgi:hypothetical protein
LRFPASVVTRLVHSWPDGLALASFASVRALSGNRVLVYDRAKIMQFNGLRWVDTPAVMLTEHHKLWQTLSEVQHPIKQSALMQLTLIDFSIHLDDDGDRTVVVSTSATTRCVASGSVQSLGVFSSEQVLREIDAQSIAASFADASATTAQAMLSAAHSALQQCQATEHR